MSKFRHIRKLWHKGLRSLPTLDGIRHREKLTIESIIPTGLNTQFDVTPDDVQELASVLRDEELAKRIRKIQTERFPYGTVPEIIMLDFFEKKGERYYYQAQIAGGFRLGGAVPDFVLPRNGRAILVNGNHWHNFPGVKQHDEYDKLVLRGSYYQGIQITDVTTIWESRMVIPNPAREAAMTDALSGIELGE